jgi:hypothetical protein
MKTIYTQLGLNKKYICNLIKESEIVHVTQEEKEKLNLNTQFEALGLTIKSLGKEKYREAVQQISDIKLRQYKFLVMHYQKSNLKFPDNSVNSAVRQVKFGEDMLRTLEYRMTD